MNRFYPRSYASEVHPHLPKDGGLISGRELRRRINAGRWWWAKWSAVGFYAVMADLENECVVERVIPLGSGIHYFRDPFRATLENAR